MQSVTYQVDGGHLASRKAALLRPFLAVPVVIVVGLYALLQLIIWPFSALLLFLRRERTMGDLERARSFVSMCSNWTAYLILLSDQWPPKAVRIRFSYSPLVSRFELIFRFFFGILLAFNAVIFGILEMPVWCLQWLHILFSGRRHPRLHKLLLIYFQFLLYARAYFWLGVDERPPLFPQGLIRALTPHSHVAHDGHL